jgi:alkylhydroperoxidase family enzyme
MPFIATVPAADLSPEQRVPDDDNIIQIHSIHPETMRHHYDLYVELMHRPGPLTHVQREMIGVVVSAENRCHY